MSWVLLIYTVPSEPSRKRAAVWRALKKAGVVYLRDGVCVLPGGEATVATVREIAAKIDAFGGEATVIEDVRLDAERAAAIEEQGRAARAAEYAEIAREAEGFLAHVAWEREHREFTFAEVEELEADAAKLRRWTEQVRARDYSGLYTAHPLDELLGRCEAALDDLLVDASEHDQEALP